MKTVLLWLNLMKVKHQKTKNILKHVYGAVVFTDFMHHPAPEVTRAEREEREMLTFDEYIENASRLTFEDYDDYTLEEMANRLSFKIFECRSVFRTLPKNTRMLYIIAFNETIHEIRRRNEK